MGVQRNASFEGTLSAKLLLRVAEFCRRRGHDADALCAQVGLTFDGLAAPDARVNYRVASRFNQLALQVTGDPNFGLHLAADVRSTGTFDAGALLLMASPTVRIALTKMVDYQRYWGDGERAKWIPKAGGAVVRYHLPDSEGLYARHADECALAEIAIGVQFLTGKPIRPERVRFRHDTPRDIEEHRTTFGCPLEFGTAHTEIAFDDNVLSTPTQHANDAFYAVFERQVMSALARLPECARTSDSVRDVAKAALARGRCSVADTARALGTSSRTLQRRLQDEGTSFAEIVESLRRELANAYLDRGLPIAEVAALLGYSDAAAFHHAFRRWTGSSPLKRSGASSDD